jgi:hypothetical protein
MECGTVKKEIVVALAILLAFFGTMFAEAADMNHAPTTPSIPSGPTTGTTSTSYSYSTSSTDSDGDQNDAICRLPLKIV